MSILPVSPSCLCKQHYHHVWQPTMRLSVYLQSVCLVIPCAIIIRVQLPIQCNSSEPPAAPSTALHNIYSVWTLSILWMQMMDVALCWGEYHPRFAQHKEVACQARFLGQSLVPLRAPRPSGERKAWCPSHRAGWFLCAAALFSS